MDEKNENEGTVDTSELIEKVTALSRDVLLKDAVEEDVRRAELYVATARPTKIAIRFVRRRREEEECERRVAPFSDGEWVPAPGWGETTSVPTTVVADDDEATQRQVHAVTEQANVQMMDTKRVENTVPESPKTANMSSATINTDITAQWQERKRARKAAKRLKDKARVARQRRDAYENEVEREADAAVIRSQRSGKAEEAYEALEMRRQHRQLDGGDPRDLETDVGAEDGLPTAVMSVNGQMKRVKLDSGARFTVAGTD
ncbi:hypothetical protein PHMEG_00017954 [Phytophthora megakarya]|uniref:Uncharacterized protein n=1 Tax=Phytophthora megakarya TaxID=4795 RepID=A0A225VVJ3_9STRA|nr:hypothetical protein PHMEG_00017954 [Phytophthora megakarya]